MYSQNCSTVSPEDDTPGLWVSLAIGHPQGRKEEVRENGAQFNIPLVPNQ